MPARRSSSIRLLLAVSLCLGVGAESGAGELPDRCQRNAICRAHSDKGVQLSEQKNYAAALVEFEAAYAAEPAPRLMLNIGRSLYRLERPQEALRYFARYRATVPTIDPETEQALKRYELDASTALTMEMETAPEPPPAPLQNPTSRWLPRASIGLLGVGVGLLALGIGLGAGAITTGQDVSNSSHNFTTFDQGQRDAETRGMRLQTSGIVFDAVGIFALGVGGASLATWWLLRKSGSQVAAAPARSPALVLRPTVLGFRVVSLGSF